MDQLDLLGRVVEILEAHDLPYMLVGSFASAAYGEPRLTHDIDIVLQIDQDYIARWAKELRFTKEWQAVLDRLNRK